MKLITFSLWGDDPKYCVGAVRNAALARKLYPGWTCRFYVDKKTVPLVYILQILAMEDADTEIVDMPINMQGWMGMFARFLPASEDGVEVFISRDCDSRISEREAVAVQEWLSSPRLIHVMRDHPEHSAPIMGGMWGAKQHAIPNMRELIDEWNKEDRWQTDQEFLRDVIWPKYGHKILAHDDWGRFNGAIVHQPFPSPRNDNDFVGSIIGPNEERLHPEHHEGFRS